MDAVRLRLVVFVGVNKKRFCFWFALLFLDLKKQICFGYEYLYVFFGVRILGG